MTNELRELDDDSFGRMIETDVKNERHATTVVLHDLREAERRKYFAKLGYSSLFEYSVKHLGYSESGAHRRIASMRLLKELPEVGQKMEEGKLSLLTVAQAQTFFRKEEKQTQRTLSTEEKKEVLTRLEGKSTREAERELLSLSSQPEIHLKEKTKPVSEERLEMSFFADPEIQELLEKIKGIAAHRLKEMSTTELIRFIAQIAWKELDPTKEPKRAAHAKLPALEVTRKVKSTERSRHIPLPVRRAVWRRDGGQCAYVDPKSGRRCEGKAFIQFDHYPIPFASGGPHTVENLRLACFQHNQLPSKSMRFIPKTSSRPS